MSINREYYPNAITTIDSVNKLIDFVDFSVRDFSLVCKSLERYIIHKIEQDEAENWGRTQLFFDLKTENVTLASSLVTALSLKGLLQTSEFQLCIGTEKSTNLPDATFDKIIMLSAFHEFTYMDEMITDISKILKPEGKIYIVDAFCSENGHVNYTSDEVILKMKKHGFTLEKLQGTNKSNSNGLYKAIFKKTG